MLRTPPLPTGATKRNARPRRFGLLLSPDAASAEYGTGKDSWLTSLLTAPPRPHRKEGLSEDIMEPKGRHQLATISFAAVTAAATLMATLHCNGHSKHFLPKPTRI